MGYAYLADALAAVHLAFVCFVLFGQLAILAGWPLRWGWVRNFWFRSLHLLAIAIVAAESLLKIDCPLTIWEQDLRALAGQDVNRGATFVGELVRRVLFYQPEDQSIFTKCYVAFALLVLLTFVMVPPRLPRRRRAAPAPDAARTDITPPPPAAPAHSEMSR
jgi:hypothetical protein